MKVRFNSGMNKRAKTNSQAIRVIEALGGPSKTSELLGGSDVITPQAISQWKTNGIPKGWRAYLLARYPKAFANKEPATAASA